MILPLEIMTAILVRLPAKSLLQFKIVCKLLNDLIKSPYFANLHLEQSLATQSNLHFVFGTPTLHLADFDTFDNPIQLNYPFKDRNYGGVGIVGSCHGLLCLLTFDFQLPLFIYNPTTQTYRSLPFLGISPPFSYFGSIFDYGFGYDSVSKDYKCVRILRNFNGELGSFESEVVVYSFKDNVWRMIHSVPCNFDYHGGKNVLLHSTLHWTGARSGNDGVFLPIVAFDLRDESFSTIPLPDLDTTGLIRIFVGIIDDCLCLCVSYMNDCQVWVMKEYNVIESWTRLFSIAKRNGYEELERPLCYSMNNEELFVHINVFHQLVTVDLDTMNITDVKTADLYRCTDAYLCVENLRTLENGFDHIIHEEEQHLGKKSSRWRRKSKK